MGYFFLYVWRNSNEFELSNSVRILRKSFPDAKVFLVGDIPGCKQLFDKVFPFKQVGREKATRTTGAILHGARMLKEMGSTEMVLMSDDEYIFPNYDFSPMHRGLLRDRGANNEYYTAQANTADLLKFIGCKTYNYECHQPCKMDIDFLLREFKCVNINYPHLLKSLYFNIRMKLIGDFDLRNGENLKTANVAGAKSHIEKHGAFSSIHSASKEMKKFILDL